MTCRPSYYYC